MSESGVGDPYVDRVGRIYVEWYGSEQLFALHTKEVPDLDLNAVLIALNGETVRIVIERVD